MKERLTPQSLEAEQSTLGAMLMERDAVARAIELVSREDFYRELHKKIYAVIVTLWSKGEPIDIVTVAEELRRIGQLEDVGGSEYLFALFGQCPSSANIEAYAKVVQEKSILRQLLKAADAISGMAYGEESEVGDVLERAQEVMTGIAMNRPGAGNEPRALDDLLLPAFGALMRQMEHKGGVTGTPTGFVDVDRLLCGLQPATLIILGARPKMGKSSWAMQTALNVAESGRTTLVFSLEMSQAQLVERMICSTAGVDSQDYRRGFLDDEAQARAAQAFERLRGVPLFIEDARTLTTRDIATRARRLASKSGPLGLVVVDYLQLVNALNDRAPRHEQVSEIARSLSSLASELQCPVLALSQLSRRVEEREDKRPMLSDLRESGSLEAEAHVVMFLYRDAYYKRKNGAEETHRADENEVAELIVAAQRSGPTGVALLGWQGEFVRFVNHVPEPKEIPSYYGN